MINRKFIFQYIAIISMVITILSCKTLEHKKDPNYLGDFEPQHLGKMLGAVVSRVSQTLKPRDLTFIFAPKKNVVHMHHKFMGDNIWIYLSEENRKALIAGIDQYLNEYKNKSLLLDRNNKKATFGSTLTYMSWGLLGGVAHESYPRLRFEYQILGEKNRPYFIIASATKASIKKEANSPAIRIALSPSKCQDLLMILKQETLMDIVSELQDEFEQYDVDDNFDLMKEVEKSNVESNEDVDEDELDPEFQILEVH